MVFEIDVSEIPIPPGSYLESARLSLIEDLEKVTIERLRKEQGLEHNSDGSKQTDWHKHARDHRHDAWKNYEPSLEARKSSDETNINKPQEPSPGPVLHGLHNPEKDPNAPEDKGYFVLIIVCLFGLVHMLPLSFMMISTEHTWRMKPKQMLYVIVIRPIITYGSVAWWKKGQQRLAQTKLSSLQRQACLLITGAFRTTPTGAMEVLLGLTPLHIYLQRKARWARYRLYQSAYWMFKFRNTTSNNTDANDRTYYQANFASLGRLYTTGPGVLCTFAATLIGHKIKAQTRIFMVLLVHIVILLAHTIFAKINTDEWQKTFFYLTLFLQMFMMCAMSLGGSGSMGLISKLPPRYMKAQLIGDGGSQLFSAILRLVFIWITPSVVDSALAYFITGVALMAITSILFYFAIRTPFFRHYTHQRSIAERKEAVRNFKECKEIFLILWPMMIVTVLPIISPTQSISYLVVSEYFGTDSVWGSKFFVTTCTYLIPSITGLIGRGLYNYFDIDCPIPLLFVLSLTKEIIFGACVFLSNAKPRKNLPVLLNHDWEYGISMALSTFSSGFIMNLSMMKTMRMSPPNRIELGMMVNMCAISIFSVAASPIGVLGVSLL